MPGLFTPASVVCAGWFTFVLALINGTTSQAQDKISPPERVSNIRLTALDQTSLEILYDLSASLPGDSVYFEVTGRNSGGLAFNPGFVEGDFGRHVRAGLNKRIVWNVIANGYELNEEIRVRVLVKPIRVNSSPKAALQPAQPAQDSAHVLTPVDSAAQPRQRPLYRPGGPLMALASVVVPGLGNVLVQSPKPKVGWRPLLTVGVAGALFYGFSQRQQARDQYTEYRQQKNPDAGEPYFQHASTLQHRYYVATRLAAAVWLGDVVATFVRGLRNQHQRTAPAPVSLRLTYQSTVPVAAFTLRF